MENKEYKAKIEKLENLIKLMKLQIEKPDIQFQLLQYQEAGLDSNGEPKVKAVWVDCKPDWNLNTKYRVKPLEWYDDPNMKNKPVWCKSYKGNEWETDIFIDIFLEYDKNNKLPFNCLNGNWKYAKPVKHEEIKQRRIK